ncbi:MAG: YjjG family noncanonical pyrimidine nucleotidase [bacterium]
MANFAVTMSKKYRHLFFDLDRTLWDFDSSARMAFDEIYLKFNLNKKGIEGVGDFIKTYTRHNEHLWSLYREGKITKELLRSERFRLTLSEFKIDDDILAESIGNEYIKISPLRVALFPNVVEILGYVRQKYSIHLITNGFSEVQDVKLRSAGLGKFFHSIVTSEEAGFKKPDLRIFDYAFLKSGARAQESIMIGDDPEVDILGAKRAGMDQVLFDPHGKYVQNGSTYYIRDLIELKEIV